MTRLRTLIRGTVKQGGDLMDDLYISAYPNRTLCDVLKEMRKCYETRNFAYILALIEEAQSLGNRMEAKLEDNKDVRNARDVLKQAKEELRQLKSEMGSLKEIQKLSK